MRSKLYTNYDQEEQYWNWTKKFLKQNKKYKYPKQDSSHKLLEVFYEEIYDFLNNDKGERYPKRLEEEIYKSDMNWKRLRILKYMAFQRS